MASIKALTNNYTGMPQLFVIAAYGGRILLKQYGKQWRASIAFNNPYGIAHKAYAPTQLLALKRLNMLCKC